MSTSVGYSNPISSSRGNFPYIPGEYKFGGGIPGSIPKATYNTNNNTDFVNTRFSLKNAWSTGYAMKMLGLKIAKCTPFRAVNNSGDLLSRQNYSCGGSCQTPQSRPGLRGLKTHFGSIHSQCDDSDVQPSSCNVKFVSDSSDYIRFAKQTAINKNINDASYGGNESKAAQSAIKAIRRY